MRRVFNLISLFLSALVWSGQTAIAGLAPLTQYVAWNKSSFQPNPWYLAVSQAVDPIGNTYVASTMEATTVNGQMTSSTLVINKYDFNGNLAWSSPFTWQAQQSEDLRDVHIFAASNGRVYCCVGGYPNGGSAYVSHLFAISPTGAILNENDYDGLAGHLPNQWISLALTDGAGECLVTSIIEDPLTGVPVGTSVTKFDPSLFKLWTYRADGLANVLSDANGNIVLGVTHIVIDPVSGLQDPLKSYGSVVRLNGNGQPSSLWPDAGVGAGVRKVPGLWPQITIDRAGKIIVLTGQSRDWQTTSFPAQYVTISNSGKLSTPVSVTLPGFATSQSATIGPANSLCVKCTRGLAKIDSKGALVWSRTWPMGAALGPQAFSNNQLAFNPRTGDVYVAAMLRPGGTDPNAEQATVYKFASATGTTVWQELLNTGTAGPAGNAGNAALVNVDAGDNVIVSFAIDHGPSPIEVETALIAEQPVSRPQLSTARGHFRDNGSQTIWSSSGGSVSKDFKLFSVGPYSWNGTLGSIYSLSLDLFFFTLNLGDFGAGINLNAAFSAGLDAEVNATGGGLHVNYPIAVALSAPGRADPLVRPGSWFPLTSTVTVDPAASMATDAANADAKLVAHETPQIKASLVAEAFSLKLIDFTFLDWNPGEIRQTLFDTKDYTSGSDFTLFNGLVDGHVQVPQVSTTAAVNLSTSPPTFASSGQDPFLTTSIDVTGVIADFTPLGPIFSNDIDFGIGDIGWNLLALEAGLDLDLIQAFNLKPGVPYITLLDSSGKAVPVKLANGSIVASYPAGQPVSIQMPPTGKNISFRPALSLPTANFTNNTGVGLSPFVGFVPIHLWGGLSFDGYDLFSLDFKPYELKTNIGALSLPVYGTTFGLQLKNASVTQPVTISADTILPEVLGTSLPFVECYIFDQTSINAKYANVLGRFSAFEGGVTSFLIFGRNFDFGSTPHFIVHGHDQVLTNFSVLNVNTIRVSVPNYLLMLPGIARIVVSEANVGNSNTLDFPIQMPIPNPATIGPSFWASDPGFNQVLVSLPDDGNAQGFDTFIHRRDYYSLFKQLWNDAHLNNTSLPTAPSESFFPEFDFKALPPLPTVFWNGRPLLTYGDPQPTGDFWASLPHAAIALANPVTATLVSPGPGGGSSLELFTSVSAPKPIISNLLPTTITPGSPDCALRVTGPANVEAPAPNSKRSNFNPESIVLWNGKALKTKFISSSVLVATVPAANVATAGSATITVTTPSKGTTYYVTGIGNVNSGGLSNALTLKVGNPIPVVTRLLPSQTTVGLYSKTTGSPGVPVTIVGSGFGSAVSVWVDGTQVSGITRQTAKSVTFTMPAALLNVAGYHFVQVKNSDSGLSTPTKFAVYPKATLNGTVVLSDFVGNPAGRAVEVKIYRKQGTGTNAKWVLSDDEQSVLTAAGTFTVKAAMSTSVSTNANVNALSVAVMVHVQGWCSARTTITNIAPGGTLNFKASLLYNGDADHSDKIDSKDLALINTALGSKPGGSNWNAAADVNGDGIVNALDVQICTKNQGKAAPSP